MGRHPESTAAGFGAGRRRCLRRVAVGVAGLGVAVGHRVRADEGAGPPLAGSFGSAAAVEWMTLLLFDFVLKRRLVTLGKRFGPAVFRTRPFFARTGAS